MNKKYDGKGVYDTVKAFLFGRNNFQPKVRDLLKYNGDRKIIKMYAYRAPLNNTIKGIINFLTKGQISKNMENLNYDEIYHLALHIILDDNKHYMLEKNHVIQINDYRQDEGSSEMEVNSKNIKLYEILINAKQYYNGKEYFEYNSTTNNCQRFVQSLLKGSNLLTIKAANFIYQDPYGLVNNTGSFRKISSVLTKIAEKADILIHGGINYI